MLTKDFDRNTQYCLKYDGKLSHAWNCESEPDDAAWTNIENACFFDIKLYPDIQIGEYKKVIEKIKQISQNKFIWLHCSNTPAHILNDSMIKVYWDIIKLFHSGTDFGIEFEHKLVEHEKQEMRREFFTDIMDFSKDKNLSWAKVYQLDNNESTEYMFFHKNREIILDKSQ